MCALRTHVSKTLLLIFLEVWANANEIKHISKQTKLCYFNLIIIIAFIKKSNFYNFFTFNNKVTSCTALVNDGNWSCWKHPTH